MVDIYYIDASDLGPNDDDSVWTNEANAVDGATGTYATCNTPNFIAGEPAASELRADGTNAPSSGDTITQVRIRNHNGTGWGSYVTLSAPSGGWTWAKVQGLESFTEGESLSSTIVSFLYADGDFGGTILGSCSVSTVSGEYRLSKIEIEVTSSAATGTNIQLNIGDDWKTVDAVQINIGDDWKDVAGMQINIGDIWKTIF